MGTKHNVAVFDDELSQRMVVLRDVLGETYNVFGSSYFTKASLDAGDLGVFVSPDRVIKSKPEAIITDLILIPSKMRHSKRVPSWANDWTGGVKLLRQLYQYSERVPDGASFTRSVFVVSTAATDAKEAASLGLTGQLTMLSRRFRLAIRCFYWNHLEGDRSGARQAFRTAMHEAVESRDPKPMFTWGA